MADHHPEARLLSGSTASPASLPPSNAGEISFRQIFGVLRRRYRLVLLTAALGIAIGAYLASRETLTYSAHAVLRVADERRALAGTVEAPTAEVSRTADPILSLVQMIRSRNVLGGVVDSLGLQLQPQTPGFRYSMLSKVAVDPQVLADSITLTLAPDRVTAVYDGHRISAHYGEILRWGSVRFAVTHPPAGITQAVLAVLPRAVAIDWLFAQLTAFARPETDLIDVTFVSSDPKLAQQVVNRTIEIFQTLNIQSARQQSHNRRVVLEDQLAQTDSTLALAQAQLAAFRSRMEVGSSASKLEAEQAALLGLNERRAELETDRSTYAGLLKQLQSGGDTARTEALRALAGSPALGDNREVADLYQRLRTSQYRLDSMTTGPWAAAPTNPDVVALRRSIQNTQNELTQAVSAHVAALDVRINSLGAQRQNSSQSIQSLPAVVEEEMRLTTRVEALSELGKQLRQDYQRARLAEEVEAGEVAIVDPADVPYAPLPTAASLKFGLGLVLGCLLGGGLAFLLEAMNTSIRRPEEIESVLHLPGLAIIPRLTAAPVAGHRRLGAGANGSKARPLSRSSTASVGTMTEPFAIGIEAFRMLRTSLVWSGDAGQLKTLVVTSAAPGEGKTLTAANLAVSFAHDGLQVLLIDCDVRRPRLHGLFREPRSPGLLDLLAPSNGAGTESVGSLSFDHKGEGDDPLARVLRSTSIRGLTLLTCGTLPTNASNLLSSVRMQSLLTEAKHRFDLVILDTPPVLATADAGILGGLTDGVLMVVRAGQTDRSAAQQAYQRLKNAGAHIVGAVLNDPKGQLSEYGDYYYPYEYKPE